MDFDPEEVFSKFEQMQSTQRVGLLFRETLALRDFARKKLCPFVATSFRPPFEEGLELAVLLLLERVALWTDTLAALDNAAHFQAVAAGQRCLFELLVDLKLLLNQPELVALFHEFTFVERYYVTKQQASVVGASETKSSKTTMEATFLTDPANIARYQKSRQHLWRKESATSRVMHWSGIVLSKVVKSLGGDIERRYVEKYPYACWLERIKAKYSGSRSGGGSYGIRWR
ncbi:MAG: hypothetical protein SGJ19_27680 [Planctomycetia bacterium]|nr:hypothetical protein [Planctomycetia bacterium]